MRQKQEEYAAEAGETRENGMGNRHRYQEEDFK
jgi:hypothetical protein